MADTAGVAAAAVLEELPMDELPMDELPMEVERISGGEVLLLLASAVESSCVGDGDERGR